MIIYALDTNTITFILKKDDRVLQRLKDAGDTGNDFVIPPIAYNEIVRGLLEHGSITKLRRFENLCEEFGIGEMTVEAWYRSAEIWRDLRAMGRPVGDADIYIAGFCLVNGYTLVTNNTKDFQNISGLKIVDWKNG